MGATSIKIDRTTRDRLARLKSREGESYDELLNQLLRLVPDGDDEGPYSDAFRAGFLDARLDPCDGRTVAHEGVRGRSGPT